MRSLWLVAIVSAAWQISHDARALVDALIRALDRAGICPKAAAYYQGISESQWNHQLHGRHGAHVSLYRVSVLVQRRPDVLRFWLEEMVSAVQARLVTDVDMRRLIDGLQTLILLTQASDRRPMLKADLPTEQEKERVS